VRHTHGHTAQIRAQQKTVLSDPAVQNYIAYLGSIRGNNGQVSKSSITKVGSAVRNFLNFTDIPISDHAVSELIAYKTRNPASTDIEKAVSAYATLPVGKNNKPQADRASYILAIFGKGNFTPLKTRVNTHGAEPAEINCTMGILREIYTQLKPEQQDMIQWGLYVPQRAKAAYRVPLELIDLRRSDYAIVTIEPTVGINKARVKHPCFPPVDFARRIVNQAKAAGRTSPFPNHESLWKPITAFALTEYHITLNSKTLRNMYEREAYESKLNPAIAAFTMGDKTKLNATGHLPLIYNPALREKYWEEMATEITNSGIIQRLTLDKSSTQHQSEIHQLKRQITDLQSKLSALTSK
jgi:hypothetical protein